MKRTIIAGLLSLVLVTGMAVTASAGRFDDYPDWAQAGFDPKCENRF